MIRRSVRPALCLLAFATACSGGDGDTDAGPQFDRPQILPERGIVCLNFQTTPVDQPVSVPLAFRNFGQAQLVIDEIRLVGDDRGHFTLDGPDKMVVEFGDDSAFAQLVYRPGEPGWDDAFVEVISNAENFPLLRIAVLARATPAQLDGGASDFDAGPKPPETFDPDGGETCPDPVP